MLSSLSRALLVLALGLALLAAGGIVPHDGWPHPAAVAQEV